MMRRLISLAALSLGAMPFYAQTAKVSRATLRVTVVDAVGNPIPGAMVEAQPLVGLLAMMLPWCKTGPDGKCVISNLDLCRYYVFASKPEDDYPPLEGKFFITPGSPQTIVTFSANHTEDDTVVPIGKKGGILKGTVADAATGKPLNANVEFRWVSDPSNFLSGSGLTNAHFRIVVPSGVAFTMRVSLDGYEPWTWKSPSNPAQNSIQLHPGEELALDIRLQPKHP